MNSREAEKAAEATLDHLATALPNGPWIFLRQRDFDARNIENEKTFTRATIMSARRWLTKRLVRDEPFLIRVPFTYPVPEDCHVVKP